jgi:hypothetical protein
MIVLFVFFGALLLLGTIAVALVVDNWTGGILTVFVGGTLIFALWHFAIEEGYQKPQDHWNTVTDIVDGHKVDHVMLTYQRGSTDGRQVEYIEEIFGDAVVPPLMTVRTTDRYIDGCELKAKMPGLPGAEVVALTKALETVFHCTTTVTALR